MGRRVVLFGVHGSGDFGAVFAEDDFDRRGRAGGIVSLPVASSATSQANSSLCYSESKAYQFW